MNTVDLIARLRDVPESIEFSDVMDVIAANYDYKPTRFTNGIGRGAVVNEAGTNEGSCKIFAFAQLKELSEVETLACFGDYYRHEVLGNPEGSDHANIRSFMQHGWQGIQIEGEPLIEK
ncbi:HopJ type III effector protein [Halieaceae bacterium]|nr:HopJ type III effector protein [Halieaceae bacterium]